MLTKIEKRVVNCYLSSDEEYGYIIKQMLVTPFPHRDPGDVPSWTKQVNNFEFTINPLIKLKDGKIYNYGIPYGATARVILLHMITEAKKSKQREIIIGKSFTDFLRKMGYDVTGGKKGSINRIKEQLKRIVTCSCTWGFEDNDKIVISKQIVSKALLWKGEFSTGKGFGSILFSQEFYEMIKNNYVPVNYNIVKAIKHSSLALDVYFWVNYVTFYNDKKKVLTYETLRNQFAPESRSLNFKRDFKKCLSYLKVVGMDINILESKNSIILFPSKQLKNSILKM